MKTSTVFQRVEGIAAVAAVALVVFGCALILRPFVSVLLWAAILCFSTWPLYRRLQTQCRGRNGMAAGLMTLLVALIMVVPFVIVGFTFADNLTRLVDRIGALRDVRIPPPPAWLPRLPLAGDYLWNHWTDLAANTSHALMLLKDWFIGCVPWLLRRGIDLGRGILELSLSVLIAFFFYRDGEFLAKRTAETAKRVLGEYSQHLLTVAGRTVQGVVYGILGTALGQGIMAAIGFQIAGLTSPLLLGLLTFLLALVPAGPPLVWVPVTIWLFRSGHHGMGIFMALWGFFAISGIDNFLRPLLISRGSSLPFALVFLGALGGIMAFGFIGVFLGPTLLAVGYGLLQEFLRRPASGAVTTPAIPPPATDPAPETGQP